MKRKYFQEAKYYTLILLALCALLFANLGATYLSLGAASIYLTLLFPVCMTCIIMIFCMHLKSGDALTRIVAVAGFCWLALLFALSLTDFLTRVFIKP